MWRALFLAIGMFICLIGLQCLVIEKAVFANFAQPVQETNTFGISEPAPRGRVVVPPDWAPWAFLASGVVVILYSFTIPRRMRS
ncbi:MAG: hypothetical protein OES79_05440 [Planctomycetota bacterium]|nr:hypothetical protein [Planctomycetota bacterium]